MISLKAYLRLNDGKTQKFNVKTKIEPIDDVHAVCINAFSKFPLDSEFGAGIEVTVDDLERWMADFRDGEYWCRPAFGTREDLTNIPNETQGLIYTKTDGTYGVILPVVSENYKCVLTGTEDNTILAKLFSWNEGMTACKGLAFMWAEGDNPYILLEQCCKSGLKLLETGYRSREQRRYPEIFEYLGWCSWDAFQIRVSEESLLAKCQEFKDKGIPVKWAIIDDMWAEVHDFYDMDYETRQEMFRIMHASKLYSFKADPIRFPNGLKECIRKINEYDITVGMWHPTTGYWTGIDPDGEIYRDHKNNLIKTTDGLYVHSPERGKAYEFYNAFHDYLRKCGTEFIKIDNQSMSRRYFKNHGSVGQVARQFHDAMEASVGQHFDNQMINCMGMASEDMWNRSVSPISRCSNDFQPENKEWFTKHIMQCAYNCLIQGQFYYCDWDMWWTDDGQALKNSVLRAISGGPIYISDTLDRSRAEILKPLILQDGRILRCDRPAMPTRDCLTLDPTLAGNVFKIQNICDNCGVIAAFNLDAENNAVTGTISPKDVEGLHGEEFAIYEYFSRELIILQHDEEFTLSLKDNDEFKLYILVPLTNGCGMIGRIDKFIAPKTVKYSGNGEAELIEAGPYAYIKDKQLVIVE